MGIPMILMSFFHIYDVLPFAQQTQLMSNGEVVEISTEQEEILFDAVSELFSNSMMMPAFAVTTPEMFAEQIKEGNFLGKLVKSNFYLFSLRFKCLLKDAIRIYPQFNFINITCFQRLG